MSEAISKATVRVVLVDDHAVVREGYRRLLERTSDIVVVAELATLNAALEKSETQNRAQKKKIVDLDGKLKSALATVDVRVLDHFIVGKGSPYSFAEAGLL